MTPLGSGQGGDLGKLPAATRIICTHFWVEIMRVAASCLNQDLQDFEDFLGLVIVLDGMRSSQLFESGFSGFRGFFRVVIVLDSARSSMLFESGFSGFRGFFSARH